MRLRLLFACLAFSFVALLQAQDLHFRDRELPCLDKQLSIVVHLVQDQDGVTGISDEQLDNQLEFVNRMFSPICLSFEFCEVREIENFQYNTVDSMGVWDEIQVTYNVPGKINVYYVETLGFVTDLCGFGTFRGVFLRDSMGGILIQKQCVRPDAADLAHQIGHYFGLSNTFIGGELVARTDCETTGDSLCDTPADNFELTQPLQNYITFLPDTCRFTSSVLDPEGQYYCPDVGNVMSNYAQNDPTRPYIECRCGFTQGQLRKLAQNCEAALR